jgi:hypothetical protein
LAPEGESGLQMLQSRVERGKRVIPPPRQPGVPVQEATPDEVPVENHPELAPSGRPTPAAPPSKAQQPDSPGLSRAPRSNPVSRDERGPKPLILPGPDEPLANLAVRVRRSLDDRVTDLIHDLRRHHGIRISKAELLEVLLAELPSTATADFVSRVNNFRNVAPPRP